GSGYALNDYESARGGAHAKRAELTWTRRARLIGMFEQEWIWASSWPSPEQFIY
ncbi:hypothetical protein A2U01_0051946, partial [Trifolium medium]|nr:hypothetical protein [Trifolium medium]